METKKKKKFDEAKKARRMEIQNKNDTERE